MLTIISTIFIPLNFIAGVYGMNFDRQASPLNMPELDWYFGYPAVLTVMAITGGAAGALLQAEGLVLMLKLGRILLSKLTSLLSLLFFGLALWLLRRELDDFRYRDISSSSTACRRTGWPWRSPSPP